jgi:hypothetical protein
MMQLGRGLSGTAGAAVASGVVRAYEAEPEPAMARCARGIISKMALASRRTVEVGLNVGRARAFQFHYNGFLMFIRYNIYFSAGPVMPKKWTVGTSYNAGGAPGLVSITEGEEVMELSAEIKGWTMIKKADGSEGSVPSKHLGNAILK